LDAKLDVDVAVHAILISDEHALLLTGADHELVNVAPNV
jgi:hypothetical protein